MELGDQCASLAQVDGVRSLQCNPPSVLSATPGPPLEE
jgi:hypothetical protein